MTNLSKPRFHDEECFGYDSQTVSKVVETNIKSSEDTTLPSCEDLIHSAQGHFSNQNVKAAVDDIINAYETLARERAKLTALRNLAFRELSTVKGWQASPHPQALRLRRLTPSIPIHSSK